MSYEPLDQSILNQIQAFNKRGLKPTETVERHNTYIADPEKAGGSFDDDEIVEFQDEPRDLKEKIQKLAQAVKECSYLVAYTGAGISTSAQIPDYRGPQGVWTLREKGIRPLGPKITLEQAIPTYAHMSLVALQNNNILKHVVSTNVDGLHIRSGIKRSNLSELHGNCYQERCADCGYEYNRTYDATKKGSRADHWTGNYCEQPGCKGKLLDTIINFGEMLPKKEFKSADENSKLCDLALVCGTSMRVSPACNLPEYSYKKQGGKLVICNRQKTPYDKYAYLKIHADLDDVFAMLMEELKIDVPDATPEGHPIRVPVLSLEEKYEKFQQSLALKKQEVIDKKKTDSEIRNPKLQLQNSVPFIKQKQNFVEGKNETKTVALPTGTLAYFKNCQNCVYTITDKLSKVILESCENVTLNVDSVVMTGTCEVIGCKGLKLNINQAIPTLQVELSENVSVAFADANLMKNVYSARCTQFEVSNNKATFKVPAEKDVGEEEWKNNQYLTRYRHNESSGQFVTDAVVREGGGYATTQKEKDARDKLQKRNEELMQQFVKDMINGQNKN